jgi:hypothetical protein
MFFNPFINGSNQAIWQSKVPLEVQGRVFSARALIAQVSAPIAMLITGPLADGVLIPGMREGGFLTPSLGWILGTGEGAGISLLYLAVGIVTFAFSLGGFSFREVREVEVLIPDHDSPTNNKM